MRIRGFYLSRVLLHMDDLYKNEYQSCFPKETTTQVEKSTCPEKKRVCIGSCGTRFSFTLQNHLPSNYSPLPFLELGQGNVDKC